MSFLQLILVFQEDTAGKLVAGTKKVDDYDIPGVEMKTFVKQMQVASMFIVQFCSLESVLLLLIY